MQYEHLEFQSRIGECLRSKILVSYRQANQVQVLKDQNKKRYPANHHVLGARGSVLINIRQIYRKCEVGNSSENFLAFEAGVIQNAMRKHIANISNRPKRIRKFSVDQPGCFRDINQTPHVARCNDLIDLNVGLWQVIDKQRTKQFFNTCCHHNRAGTITALVSLFRNEFHSLNPSFGPVWHFLNVKRVAAHA